MSLNNITNKYNFALDDSSKEKYKNEIILLFNNNIIPETDDGVLLNIIGIYYGVKIKNYELMKKYYVKASDKGNAKAMCNLGIHYANTEKNYDIATKYYLMAIEKNNSTAMLELGYYCIKEKNYDLGVKYYLMAVEKNNELAMERLGFHYETRKPENYDLMKKYYSMLVKKNPRRVEDLELNGILDHDINIVEIYLEYPEKCYPDILTFVSKYNNLNQNEIVKYRTRLRLIYAQHHILLNKKLIIPDTFNYNTDSIFE